MQNLKIIGLVSLVGYLLTGCATQVIDGVSSKSRNEGAVIIGEGHGAGRVFLDVIPGASRVAGDKAPGIPNALKIQEIDGHPISPSQGDEYWIKAGTYSFLITCKFKNSEGYLRSASGTTEASVEIGKEYDIQGHLKVVDQDFLGRNRYQCETQIVEKT